VRIAIPLLLVFAPLTHAAYEIDQLPFPENIVRQCTQNGTGTDDVSHNADDTAFDLDFTMPIGSEVVAAKSGYAVYTPNAGGWGNMAGLVQTPKKLGILKSTPSNEEGC